MYAFFFQDEMLAMALAPGVRMARSMSIGGKPLSLSLLRLISDRSCYQDRLGTITGESAQKTTTPSTYAGGEDDRLALNMLEAKEGGKKKARRPRSDSTKRTPKIRVYGISDLHADFIENMEWLKDLPTAEYKNDVRTCLGNAVFCVLPLCFASLLFVVHLCLCHDDDDDDDDDDAGAVRGG
jgi:hypothetical protein